MTALISKMRQDSALNSFVSFIVIQMAHPWNPQAVVRGVWVSFLT